MRVANPVPRRIPSAHLCPSFVHTYHLREAPVTLPQPKLSI
jgi:hypothetical protein